MSRDESWTTCRLPSAVAWLLAMVVGTCLLGSGDSREERRERVRGMTSSEQARLRENLRRFEQLDTDTQERLRQIHDELEQDTDPAALRGLMRRYCRWLAVQLMATETELADLSADQRLARIKEMVTAEQDDRGARRWLFKYNPAILDWAEKERRDQTEPNRQEAPHWVISPETMRKMEQAPGDWIESLRAAEQDKVLKDLRSGASEETAKSLLSQTPRQQVNWVYGRLRQRGRPFGPHFLRGPRRQVSEEQDAEMDKQLAELFTKKTLADQDQLLSLPGEEMYEWLDRERLFGWGGQRGPGEGRPGGPRGPREGMMGGPEGPGGPREGMPGGPGERPGGPDSRPGPRGPQDNPVPDAGGPGEPWSNPSLNSGPRLPDKERDSQPPG